MARLGSEKSPVEGGEEPVLSQTTRVISEKGIHNLHDGAPADIANGHLVELEVDLSRVIGEDDVEGDWDADTSPFPAVRAVVPETDDTEIPLNTFRAWFLGIVSNVPSQHSPRLLQSTGPTELIPSRCSSSSVPESTSSSP